jgi:hypothetical protein
LVEVAITSKEEYEEVVEEYEEEIHVQKEVSELTNAVDTVPA